MNKVLNLTYDSSITDLCEVNSSFAAGTIRIAYTGRNRNGSVISKNSFEKCLPTIYNCPIVCNYNREENDFGSHDVEIIKDKDGDFRLINVTTPIGVVPMSAKTFWEEYDGHEYLCVEALFWKRQEAYQKLKEEGFASQSMEITVKNGHKDKKSGDYIIEDFEFTAFCVLGENVEPCFESANVALFSKAELKEQIEEMMSDFKSSFNLIDTSSDVEDIFEENSEEGGNVVLKDFEKKPIGNNDPAEDDEVVVQIEENDNTPSPMLAGAPTYPQPENQEDVQAEDSVDENSEEAEENPEDELSSGDDNDNPDIDSEELEQEEEDSEEDENDEELYALNSLIHQEICEKVSKIEIADLGWGPEPRYWVWDFDPDECLVYCEDSSDWKLYSFSYTMDGDNVVIDASSKKRVKIVYAEFDEGSKDLSLSSIFSALTSNIVSKYHEASDTLSSIETELNELRKFKAETEGAIENEKRESVFAQFDDLNGVEAFEKLKESNYDYDTLEEKCYAIRGKIASAEKFSLETKSPKLPVEKTENTEEVVKAPYGGIVEGLLNR